MVKTNSGREYIISFLDYTLTHMKKNDIVKLKGLLKTKFGEQHGKKLMASAANHSTSDISNLTGLSLEEISKL